MNIWKERESVLVAQSCLTLWDPMDCSLTDSSVPGISQARTLDGLPFLSPGDLPDPGIAPRSPHCRQIHYCLSHQGRPWTYGTRCLLSLHLNNNNPVISWRLITEKQINCCIQFSSVQFSLSVVSDSLRPQESQHARPPCPSPSPWVTQTHIYRVGDAIQPSHPLSSPFPPAPCYQNILSMKTEWQRSKERNS